MKFATENIMSDEFKDIENLYEMCYILILIFA